MFTFQLLSGDRDNELTLATMISEAFPLTGCGVPAETAAAAGMRTQTARVWAVARPQTHHALPLLQRFQVLRQALVGHIERRLALARRQTQQSRASTREQAGARLRL